MFCARQIRSICLIVILSVLLIGMCPTGMVADSFLACSNARSVAQDTTGTILRSPSNTIRNVVYTQETLPEYETFLTPTTSLRRISMRQLNRDYYSVHRIPDILSIYFNASGNHTGCLLVKNSSNMVIVNYIHHQDGAKA